MANLKTNNDRTEAQEDAEILMIAKRRFALALIAELTGDIKTAIKYYEKAHQLNPSSNMYRNHLKMIKLKKEN